MLKTIEASFLWIIFLLIEDKEILAQNSLFNLKIIHKNKVIIPIRWFLPKSTLEFLFQIMRNVWRSRGPISLFSISLRFLFSILRSFRNETREDTPFPLFSRPFHLHDVFRTRNFTRFVSSTWNADSQALWLSTSHGVSSIISLEYRPSSYIALAPDYAYISITRIGPTRKIKPLVDSPFHRFR